ncbi:MAG: glycosyltransferase family 4 protein [Armatimonadetes bacterium]|nr:glycosyltransferase family 4 protein [Armatimonadota bacterium]MDW8121068.1 glycosyltransferase family 1 protein [Armatimonadota bacterium]
MKEVRIAVDARPLTAKGATGVENVGRLFLNALPIGSFPARWFFYSSQPATDGWSGKVFWRSYKGPAFLRLIVPFWLLRDRIDGVFFYLSYVPPLTRWTSAKTLVTVCDVMWLDRPDFLDPPSRKFIFRGVLPSLRHRTDHFIAISNATASELKTKLAVPDQKISVVAPYPDPIFRPKEKAAEAVQQLYGIEGPFFLCVGVAKPNKNVGAILTAFERLRSQHSEATLVWAGYTLPFWEPVKRLEKGGQGVRYLGYVPKEHLPILYSACQALLSPALKEGFGLPLLEAMACGSAVLAGDEGAQREVVGSAGLLVNPYDEDAIFQAMKELWLNKDLRDDLRKKAVERAAHFTKEQTTEQLRAALQKALRGESERRA